MSIFTEYLHVYVTNITSYMQITDKYIRTKLLGTSKNSMHEALSTVNGSFFSKKPRNRGTMPAFFAKKSLAHSDKSPHL